MVLSASIWLLVGIALTGYIDARLSFVRGLVDPNQLARVSSTMYLLPGITNAIGAFVVGTVSGVAIPVPFGVALGGGSLTVGLRAVLLPGEKVIRY